MQMMVNLKGNNNAGEDPPNNKRRGGGKCSTTWKPRRTCGVYGKTNVTHKDDDCYTLEKNKDKRLSWWKREYDKTGSLYNLINISE